MLKISFKIRCASPNKRVLKKCYSLMPLPVVPQGKHQHDAKSPVIALLCMSDSGECSHTIGSWSVTTKWQLLPLKDKKKYTYQNRGQSKSKTAMLI